MDKALLDEFLKYLSEYYGGRPAPEVEYFPANSVRVPVLDGVGPLNEDEFVQALNAGFGQLQPRQQPVGMGGLLGGMNQMGMGMQPPGVGAPARRSPMLPGPVDSRLMN